MPGPRPRVLQNALAAAVRFVPGGRASRETSGFERNREAWDDLAELDPYWATITDPAQKHGQGSREAYLRTGAEEIAGLLGVVARLGFPTRGQRALDFGCGLGRLTRALTPSFEECYGVDISPEMIARARELNDEIRNATFLVNGRDLRMFSDDSFDLIYSNVTLEHVPDRESIKAYIREFVRTLRPAGVLAFQLPSGMPLARRIQPRRRLYALLRWLGVPRERMYGTLGLYPILMNHIPEREVATLLETAGARVLEVGVNYSAGPLPSRTYYATKS